MRLFITVLAFLNSFFSLAQEIIYDNFSVGQNFENMVYYSLQDGEVSQSPGNIWDISFDMRLTDLSVRINCGTGLSLYYYGPIEEWGNVSFEELDVSNQLRNDPTSWSSGAFSQAINTDNLLDVGWGEYDLVTHIVTGDKVFVLVLPSGVYKKIAILSLDDGIYSFKYANLDGTDEYQVQIDKADYYGKLHVFYDIENNQVLDLEPESEWDFIATRYIDVIDGEFFYTVTGILTRNDVTSYQEDNLTDPFMDGIYDSSMLNDSINSIGYDWKLYTMGGYFVVDERCYFINDNLGNTWRVVFTSFDGSTTGNIQIGKLNINNIMINCINDLNGNGVCDEDEVYGCTYINALNYENIATSDDGSCVFDSQELGCTYELAINFNNDAEIDDGSCQFENLECQSDLNGNGSVGSSDLLIFLADYGILCSYNDNNYSYNCVNGNCIDPGDGSGVYSNYSNCLSACFENGSGGSGSGGTYSFDCINGNCVNPGDGSGYYSTYSSCESDCGGSGSGGSGSGGSGSGGSGDSGSGSGGIIETDSNVSNPYLW